MNHCCVAKTGGTKRHTMEDRGGHLRAPDHRRMSPLQDSLIANRGDFIWVHIKGLDLTCPVEFSITCTSGILVDMVAKLEDAE